MELVLQIAPDYGTDPLAMLFLFSVVLVLINSSKKKPVGAIVMITIVQFIIGSPIVVNPLVNTLETVVLNENSCSLTDTVVVLSGGVRSDADSSIDSYSYESLSQASYSRAIKATEITKKNSVSTLMVTGGPVYDTSDSEIMVNLMHELGVPKSIIEVDVSSGNTYQNALKVKAVLIENQLPLDIVLVTSAMHMWRAKYTFVKQGLSVCAAPTDFRALNAKIWNFLPQTAAIAKFDDFSHELIGMIYYRIRSRV